MLRSTVGNATNQQRLETLLQNRLGLKYMQSRKLVAAGREAIGMKADEPWTPELEAECIKQYVAEHGPIQERDYSSPAAQQVKDSPQKSFVKSTPTPSVTVAPNISKPKAPVIEKKKEEPPKEEEEEPVVEPELTPEEDPVEPEQEEEPAHVEETVEEAVPEEEPAAAAAAEEEPTAEAAAPAASSEDDDSDASDDDSE